MGILSIFVLDQYGNPKMSVHKKAPISLDPLNSELKSFINTATTSSTIFKNDTRHFYCKKMGGTKDNKIFVFISDQSIHSSTGVNLIFTNISNAIGYKQLEAIIKYSERSKTSAIGIHTVFYSKKLAEGERINLSKSKQPPVNREKDIMHDRFTFQY